MRCLLTVFCAMGMFAAFVVGGIVAAGTLIFAAVTTAHFFGWSDNTGMIIMLVYMVISLGTVVGIIECRRAA